MSVISTARDRLGAELLTRVAGPGAQRKREFIHGSKGPRWFTPDSPIGRVHGDSSMFVGGIRAIMLQSMHPAAMQGVADHSGYRGDMWGRLASIANYIAITTFGTERHAMQTINAVRKAHEPVVGTLPDGTPYEANDPHLLAWVHAAEIDSFIEAHRRYGKHPLTPSETDTYVAQCAVVAGHLGVIEPPTSYAMLQQQLADYRPELAGTEAARDAIDFLVRHPDLALPARPAYLSLVAAAVGLLPRWVRAELGLPYVPLADRTVGLALGTAATATIRWAMAPGHAHARELQAAAAAAS
jgi:uncharacterized protein (DUF2236 family)